MVSKLPATALVWAQAQSCTGCGPSRLDGDGKAVFPRKKSGVGFTQKRAVGGDGEGDLEAASLGKLRWRAGVRGPAATLRFDQRARRPRKGDIGAWPPASALPISRSIARSGLLLRHVCGPGPPNSPCLGIGSRCSRGLHFCATASDKRVNGGAARAAWSSISGAGPPSSPAWRSSASHLASISGAHRPIEVPEPGRPSIVEQAAAVGNEQMPAAGRLRAGGRVETRGRDASMQARASMRLNSCPHSRRAIGDNGRDPPTWNRTQALPNPRNRVRRSSTRARIDVVVGHVFGPFAASSAAS